MFLNPFKVVDGLTPMLTLGEVDPFESIAKSGDRIERALEDADEGLA